MRCFSLRLPVFGSLLVTCMGLGLVTARTIDEIIAGSSNAVTDFDFMGDIAGNMVRVELDMMMTVRQYQTLYSKTSTSNVDSSSLLRHKRKAIQTLTHRWTNKQIPYTIDRSVFSNADISEVNMAIQEWQNYTCIQFRPASREDLNFVLFKDGTGCSSYVGMSGGVHPVELAGGCRQKGVIAHEIGHAVGFYHEQNRPDRDDYITIQTENIIHPNLNHNFQKYPSTSVSTYNVPYDYRSIMHYGGRAFSINGQYTIKTKDPAFQEVIGNREGLSFNDIKLANLMYRCNEKCSQNIVCPNDGYLGKECQCWCRGSPIQKCNGPETRTTTRRPAVKPTDRPTTICQDININCRGWADSGYCQTNNYVKTYCKDSCSLCHGGSTSLSGCKDLRDHCQYWKKQGYCTNNIYELFMTEKCPEACGVCQTRTRNESVAGSENNGRLGTVSSRFVMLLTCVFCCLTRFI